MDSWKNKKVDIKFGGMQKNAYLRSLNVKG